MTVANLDLYRHSEWAEAEKFIEKKSQTKSVNWEVRSERQCLPFPEAGVNFDDLDDLFKSL